MKTLVVVHPGQKAAREEHADISTARFLVHGWEQTGGSGAPKDELAVVFVRRVAGLRTTDSLTLAASDTDAPNLFSLDVPACVGDGYLKKLTLEYAVLNCFDAVAFLPGARFVDAEILRKLLGPINKGGAACVVAAESMRDCMGRWAARTFDLPVGDPWEPCRAYSVKALERIPYQSCRDNGHLDFEILLQMIRCGLTVVETEVRAGKRSRRQACGVSSRLWRVIGAAVSTRLHDMGIFYRRKYDISAGETHYELKLGYPSSHTFAIASVEEGARVLDLACGSGDVADELRRKGCRVTGIDRRPADVGRFDRFVLADLEMEEPFGHLGEFDWILALDCLEHLKEPERLVSFLRRHYCAPSTRFLVTVPNVAFFPVRLALLIGQFNYGRMGILDLTHKRLFTFGSLRRMLEEAGCIVESMRGIPAPYSKAFGRGFFPRLLTGLNLLLIPIAPGLFSYQIAALCRFRPVIRNG